jgi:hypothetical protein
MRAPSLLEAFGVCLRARQPRPHFRSWDLTVTGPDGSWTASCQTKREALADKATFEGQGYVVTGPRGNTRRV